MKRFEQLILLAGILIASPAIAFSLANVKDKEINNKILFYNIKDTIHNGTVEIVEKVFSKASEVNATAILFELDTPGGLLSSTEEIVKMFLNSEIPVIVYVAPMGAKAGSAGTFITMAAHIAAMAPGTYIGAAHPVELFGGGGEEGEGAKVMKKKIESATSSFIEAIAKERGRNSEWAKKAVLESETLISDEALKKNVIDRVAVNREELIRQIHGTTVRLPSGEKVLSTTGAVIITFTPSWQDLFLNVLASPTLIYLLILAMIGGIYLEVSHPGSFVPGSLAGISLVLLLIATRTLPLNLLGVLLILGALALLIAEIYVTSFGLLTVSALVSFFAGSLLLFDPAQGDLKVPLSYVIGTTGGLGAIAIMISYSLIRGRKRPQVAGREGLIGAIGVVEEKIEPGKPGKVRISGEYWKAESDQIIQNGQKAVVTGVKGLTVTVIKQI